MIKTTAILISNLQDYVNPKAKIGRMVEKGEIFPIIRGIYEDDPKTPGCYLAGSIYGPSYISFEYALSYYGLISGKKIPVTCAAYGKRKEKKYETMFGEFTYRDIPKNVFSRELILHNENGYSFIMASPEKALCDMLYNSLPASNLKELDVLLFEEIGIGRRKIFRLDPAVIFGIADLYGCRNLHLLKSLFRKKLGRNETAELSKIQQKQNNTDKLPLREVIMSGLSRSGFLKDYPYLNKFDISKENRNYFFFLNQKGDQASPVHSFLPFLKNELNAAGYDAGIELNNSVISVTTQDTKTDIVMINENFDLDPVFYYQQVPIPYELRCVSNMTEGVRGTIERIIDEEIEKSSPSEKKKGANKAPAKNRRKKKEDDQVQQLSLFDF